MTLEKITIHPLTKILLIIVLGSMIVINIPVILEVFMILLVSLLFIQDKKYATGIKVLVVFLLLLWIDGVELRFLGRFESIVHSLCFMVRRFILPIMAAKYAINSTPISLLMSSLEKVKVPKVIIIPIAVMFRFFPTLSEEFTNIKNAMKMRGISLNAKSIICSPVSCMEYVLVPMLASSSKIGDELAAAAHTKGVDNPCEKVRYKTVKVNYWDALLIIYLFIILFIGVWSRFAII